MVLHWIKIGCVVERWICCGRDRAVDHCAVLTTLPGLMTSHGSIPKHSVQGLRVCELYDLVGSTLCTVFDIAIESQSIPSTVVVPCDDSESLGCRCVVTSSCGPTNCNCKSTLIMNFNVAGHCPLLCPRALPTFCQGSGPWLADLFICRCINAKVVPF